MTQDSANATVLWDDNPADIDLLGFDAVVAPIVDAVASSRLDPLTIGIHARWGGGKSTLLGLIAEDLESDDSVLVIRTNPWEYDDHDDVKGTLISEVLDALTHHFKDEASVGAKAKELLHRISWARVGKAVAKSVILQTIDLSGLAEALTPKGRDTPESMAGFRSEFAELIGLLPETRRVVVLVDDLDRCLPTAVTSTLEAIKLFLSVPGMVFVIAADQIMVRDAIALNLGTAAAADRYAQRYLDKIVQLPVSIPVLPPHEAEAYVGLLLAHAQMTDEQYAELVNHARARRVTGEFPLLAGMADLPSQLSDSDVRLASQLVHGLRSDTTVNPREIKRFMNAYQVRRRVAEVRQIEIRADVLAKLMILEDRHFEDLKLLLSTPELERRNLLEAWTRWARGEAEERPDGVSESSREWAAADPDLSDEQIGPYLTLAASFASERASEVVMDPALAALISKMSSESETVRRDAVETTIARSEEDQLLAIEGLLTHARLHPDASRAITSLIELASTTPSYAQLVADRLREGHMDQIDVGHAVELAQSDSAPFRALAHALVGDDSIDPQVRQAADNVINSEED